MVEVVASVGCGLGGDRRKPAILLSDRLVSTLVAERRDGLARFGVGAAAG